MRPYGGYLFVGLVGAVIVGHQLKTRYYGSSHRFMAKVAKFGYKFHLKPKDDIK